MSKNGMNEFVQAMYGTVLGVSFYHAFSDDAGGKDKLQNMQQVNEIMDFFTQDIRLFTYALFFFTILILAHDWHSFHGRKNEESKSFAWYLPQITALFFVSQMFAAASAGNFKVWFFYAIFYTAANIAGFFMNILFGEKTSFWYKGAYALIYIVHTCVSVCGFYKAQRPLSFYYNKTDNWLLFIAMAAIVMLLWLFMQIVERWKA